MSVFISYSHSDADFIDRLAAELIKNRKHVWIDRYELRAGDSLITRIQDAITGAGAMLVVLSRASVASEWCKKELSSGLMRELDEKRVLVIPLLLDDCTIPLFLRDKYYADFRLNFDKGVRDVLEAIAGVTSDAQGRIHSDDYHFDWAIDWSFPDEQLLLRITVIQQHQTAPFSVLTTVEIKANSSASQRFRTFQAAGFDWFGRGVIVEAVAAFTDEHHIELRLENQFAREVEFQVNVRPADQFKVIVSSRWLGEDTGKDVLINVGSVISAVRSAILASRGKMSSEEAAKLSIVLRNLHAG
jgi:hypothetical protein